MSIRIAHLSDLHFGGSFDRSLWESVFDTIIRLEPKIIIVSGDLVDHPIKENLESAKAELEKLATKTGAELYVVPGNHDLFYYGNDVKVPLPQGKDVKLSRSQYFEEIFNPPAEETASCEQVGFQKKPVGILSKMFSMVSPAAATANPTIIKTQAKKPLIRELESAPILLALIDSNASDFFLGLATGSISSSDLNRLDTELNSCDNQHLVRIAVLHHHVLPIAHSAGKVVGAEPFMVLQNAGDLLTILARHRFDLILHGHKHKAQFAKIDFVPETSEGYPISVVSAGSASLLKKNEPRFNSFNLIKIADNGAITVQTFFYGYGIPPHLNGADGETRRTFEESLETVKRRAFVRAGQRHRICCDKREWTFDISENGDLQVRLEVSGLRVTRGVEPIGQRNHVVSVPERGRLVTALKLDEKSSRAGYRVISKDDPNNQKAVDGVIFPESIDHEKVANYAVEHACANSIMMTGWEAKERSVDPVEWVGTYVRHPLERLVFKLKLPESMAMVRPYVRCERPTDYPRYKIDGDDDVVYSEGAGFAVDTELQRSEERHLHFNPLDKCWVLSVKRPLVGYSYQLHWDLPGDPPSEPVPSETAEWRKQLLLMSERIARQENHALDEEAARLFRVLTNDLAGQLGRGSELGDIVADLFTYDADRVCLRQVICNRPNPIPPRPHAFEIKLGDGIAGAAFQQRRIVPWSRGGQGPAFVRPVPYPHPDGGHVELPFSAMLSIPVYHPLEEDNRRPSPWSVIAVVAFATSAPTSKIPAMLNPILSKQSQKTLRTVRALSQSFVHEILSKLDSSNPSR